MPDRVRVQARECTTCVFRPGNLMRLRPGRLRQMVAAARRAESTIICHERLGHVYGRGRGAVCRGFFDRFPTAPLQIAARLRLVEFV